MTEGNGDSELDPEIWKVLPEELLERVIAKLPFSRMVAFRTVCKHWYSEIIPSAAAHFDVSSRIALLYFSYHDPYMEDLYPESEAHAKEYEGCAWWLQICNVESECRRDSFKEFCPRSFPAPRDGEVVKLLICERGLLFFGFICKEDKVVRDIIVCNPLTSQSKSLDLPRPLGPALRHEWCSMSFLAGVVFDSTQGSYCFVYAGVKGTYLYDSLSSAWTNGSSLLPTLREVGDGAIHLYTLSDRSVCCNGNLYWYPEIAVGNGSKTYVMKFDIQHDTWTLVPDPFLRCGDAVGGWHLIAADTGDLLLWHLHGRPWRDGNSLLELLSCELFDQVNVLPPQYIDWPCRCDCNLQLNPEIKLMRMPHYMMEKIYMFLIKSVKYYDFLYYNTFSQQNIIYHVVGTLQGLTVLVQDIDLNTYTELPWVDPKRLPGSQLGSPGNVWSFSPSLTWSP